MLTISEVLNLLKKLVGNKRLLIIIGGLCAVFAGLSFTSEVFLFSISRLFNVNVGETSVPIWLLMVSAVSFSLLYLQSGGVERTVIHSTSEGAIIAAGENTICGSRLGTVDGKEDIQRILRELKEGEILPRLDKLDREAAIQGVINNVTPELIATLFGQEAEQLKRKIKKNINLERLATSSKRSIERLNREIADLRLRSNINLVIGMAITLSGLYLLLNTIQIVDASDLLKSLASDGDDSNGKFFRNLVLPIIPRVLLVVFVEIFAYFFLRLYKNGLSEIKYFQNELTNIESKLTAVEFSYLTRNDDALKFAVEALSKTERNFVLEKGQTTVELEKAKSESELSKSFMRAVPKFFERSQK